MAISINSTPNQYEPAYQNSIPFVFTSTLATASNFRYTFQTYTGESYTTVNDFQSFNSAYPRFNDDCIYSPHLILQSIVDYDVQPFITNITPATSSFTYYRIDFGEQYNPNLYFENTITSADDELFLIFTQPTPFPIQVGDQIRIDKTDKSVNPQYDGYTTVQSVSLLLGFYFVLTDTPYGVEPTIGTFSYAETGYINDLSRVATQSATYSVFSGVRQYDEVNFDFEDVYGIDLDYVNFVTNSEFTNTSGWIISNSLASISGGVLNYSDTTGSGVTVVSQTGVLTPGVNYRITLQTNNNNFVAATVGDENNQTPIFGSFDNGTFTVFFTSTGSDFNMELSSTGGVTQGVDIYYILVEAIFETQHRFLSVYPEGVRKPMYLTDYETLSFFTTPENPDYTWYGEPRLSAEYRLYDPQGVLVSSGSRDIDMNYSGGTVRHDMPVGPPIDINQIFFTSSVSCDGWYYDTWLEGPDNENVLGNPTFTSPTSSWIFSTQSSNCGITNSELQFNQAIDFVTGSATIEQSDVLVPGVEYTVIVDIQNNQDTYGLAGDNNTEYPLFTDNQTGLQSITFSATGTTFSMSLVGTDINGFGIDISSIYVNRSVTASRISEIKSYDIVCQCREYELIQLVFVNKLGGLDYWTFNLVSKFRSEIIREKIKKALSYNYNIGNRQHQIINQQISQSYEINTDYISDDQSLFIRELIESPEVYWLRDGELIPIIIMDDRYDFKSSLNDIQVQYTLNFTLAYDIISNV